MTAPTISTADRLRSAYEAMEQAKAAYTAAEAAAAQAAAEQSRAAIEYREARAAHLKDVLGQQEEQP